MGYDVELIDEPGPERGTKASGSRVRVDPGTPVMVALVLVAVTIGWLMLGNRDETTTYGQPDNPVTSVAVGPAPGDPLARLGVDEAIESTNFTGPGGQAVVPTRPGILRLWAGADALIVIENPRLLYEIDLESGLRDLWDPPEPLADADPLVVGNWLVVVGETEAWATSLDKPGAEWKELGPADRVLPSTKPDRVWLRRNNFVQSRDDAQFFWSEVTLDGEITRTMIRNRPVFFPTPELVAGLNNGLFRFTDSTINTDSVVNPWQMLSENGVAVATGLNDVIAWECGENLECKRVWYDPKTGEVKTGFYPELAYNVTTRLGAFLSPDGRYVIAEGTQIEDSLTLMSIASGRVIPNLCLWSGPKAWTSNGELFACQTNDGVEIYETFRGDSMGLATNEFGEFSRFTFAPAR